MNSLFGQCNLLPFEQTKTGRVWHLSHSLLFFPPPDFLIIGDLTEDFVNTENGNDCIFINPGNFSRDYSFMIMNPLNGSVKPCNVQIQE